MKSNHIILIGYVAKDLFVTESKNGCRRVAIRMSTHYPRKNELGEKIWQTVWHDVVAWGNTAEYAERNFVKRK